MTKPKPRLTSEGLKKALEPPNNCRVKAFMATLDPDSLAVFEQALGMKKEEFPARAVVEFLEAAGFGGDDLPGVDAISNHRSGRRPCRCRG